MKTTFEDIGKKVRDNENFREKENTVKEKKNGVRITLLGSLEQNIYLAIIVYVLFIHSTRNSDKTK